jgi:putative transcriptional regulator
VRLLFLVAMLSWSALLHAADVSQPHILVAKPELRDPVFGSTILVVKPVGGNQHIGFIINRPSTVMLGELFPQHGPSQEIADPVYLGGPVDPQLVFALVERSDSPGGNSVELVPGLYLAFEEVVVDQIIESQADRARFVVGLVVWRSGELVEEIRQGAWYVIEPDAALAMRKPEGLWEELVKHSRVSRLAI